MTDATTNPSAHQADIDDIDILVGLHGTKPERDTWTRLRTALLTTPQPLAIGLDREAILSFDVQDYADGYEFRGDEGAYMPTEDERALITDAIEGVLSEISLALVAPAEVNGHVASALLWFGSQHNLELSYGYEVDGEGGDGWQVHSVNGGRNDREWTRLSFGHDTPIKAIAACLPAAPTGGRS